MLEYYALGILIAISLAVILLVIGSIKNRGFSLKSILNSWENIAAASFEEMQRFNKLTQDGCNRLAHKVN